MAVDTLDDLTPAAYKKAEAGIKKFRKTRRTRTDQDVLYDTLTNAGLSAEGADEYINMEVENV